MVNTCHCLYASVTLSGACAHEAAGSQGRHHGFWLGLFSLRANSPRVARCRPAGSPTPRAAASTVSSDWDLGDPLRVLIIW
jgi:hypothetical protein